MTRFRLEHLQLPEAGEPGPAFGVAGLRQRFGVAHGPLLCRAQRPAVGVDIQTMARLNRDVLLGGFHLAKDCELQTFLDNAAFATHVQRMIQARDEARDRSGERKGYIANLVCEPWELDARWDIACRLDVDGVLIAPMVQGLGTLAMLAQRRQLPILANNSVGHLLTRHPGWGIAHAVLCDAYQHLGADIVATAGNFVGGADVWTQWPRPGNRAPGRALPVIQGRLSPDDLPACRAAIGDDDVMLIVAAWLDAHPEGMLAAAGRFRAAVDALQL